MPAERSATRTLELPIDGMTCASCAARIEKRLNGLDGVRASVRQRSRSTPPRSRPTSS
jgi:Cu+-exporting ATPase